MKIMLKKGENLVRQHKYDSGADLMAKGYQKVVDGKLSKEVIWLEDGEYLYVEPNETILIKTGVHIKLPGPEMIHMAGENWYLVPEAEIKPRSGLTLKDSVLTNIGTIDNGYQNDCGVIFWNHSSHPYKIVKDDRVAQLAISTCLIPLKIEVVESFDKETDRGNGGFGHTGK